ncbi:Dicer-like protein 2, partial [Metarhizium majus ARSEF 297]
MIPATSPVGSYSSNESEVPGISPEMDWVEGDQNDTPTDFPNIRETISAAALQASPQEQLEDASHQGIACDNETSGTPSATAMSPRAYQLEMLDQSLKQNAIVVMDTGSGKTQVAVLRIKTELDRSAPDKIIWFLAPTVALCGQQFDVIRLQAASVAMKLLTGNDQVDTWSADTWDTILDGVRVVVSTYQVLLDALCHAFISIDRLSLIIFDEAHNCVGKHPGSKIMTDFYHHNKHAAKSIPNILGITATPSMKEDLENMEILEALLDAKCISPTRHREELLKCVKRPQIYSIVYDAPRSLQYTESMYRLRKEFLNLDITKDPYILRLQEDPSDRNRRALVRAVEKYDTFVQNQIKGLWGRSAEILQQLGTWAADMYIWKSSAAFLARINTDAIFNDWIDAEKKYLADFIRRVSPSCPASMPQSGSEVSEKATALVRELVSVEESTVCLIFVKERATAGALREFLVSCPRIVEKHRIGSMVGTSNYQSRKLALYELVGQSSDPMAALQSFRSGKINILIATSVLEEGIDVPACNMVICFDHPQTPKSFLQRRGRARMKESKLILLSEHSSSAVAKWEALEENMKAVYQDTQREIRTIQSLENSEESSSTFMEVETTGARLDFENAKSHLEHFCRVLSQGEFVDSRPDYIIHSHEGCDSSSKPRLSATVLLPSFVPSQLRQIDSKFSWRSEKNATKDAAFQAYQTLYEAGLVNKHLLPFKYEDIPGVETRAPEVEVDALLNPWFGVAKAWTEEDQSWLYSLKCYDHMHGESEYNVLIPAELSQLRNIQLYLNSSDLCELRFNSRRPISAADVAAMPDHTSALLALPFAHRWPIEEKHHIIRVWTQEHHVSMGGIGGKTFDPNSSDVIEGKYLVRNESNSPYHYVGLLPSKPPVESVQSSIFDYENAPADEPYLVVKKWTKRSDFLHPVLSSDATPATTKPYPRVIPLSWATVDSIPLKFAQFGMLIPSLMHELEVTLIAKELSTTILERINITDLRLVREAISSRSAAEPVNYERLEFLGDSILKYCTAIQVSAIHPEWPEGYLSFFKDRLVSNSRLSRAAIDVGLAKFILTKTFTGQKWRPLYLENYTGNPGKVSPRKLSTKTLADVVEALIGASYVDGGITKALNCISLFVNEIQWQDVSANRALFFKMARDQDKLPAELKPLEHLVGYQFNKKSLLIEAMTHQSCMFDYQRRSYEHLEFIGDAILDFIIVRKMYTAEPLLAPHQMHSLKTAMVNADFLAFLSLDHQMRRTETAVTSNLQIVDKETTPLALWTFMRHSSEAIGIEQATTLKRYEALRGEILATLRQGSHYPWALLAGLQAKKFYSDIFESLLGAVWVDSGSIELCECMLQKFGVLSILDRLLKDRVQVQHPKEVLGKMAVTQTVTYNVDVQEAPDGDRAFTCRVLVGQRVITEVVDGVTKEEVKTKAAEAAIRIMSAERDKAAEVKH